MQNILKCKHITKCAIVNLCETSFETNFEHVENENMVKDVYLYHTLHTHVLYSRHITTQTFNLLLPTKNRKQRK